MLLTWGLSEIEPPVRKGLVMTHLNKVSFRLGFGKMLFLVNGGDGGVKRRLTLTILVPIHYQGDVGVTEDAKPS